MKVDDNCNKMTCLLPDCGNVQCYVCSESCDYSHFSRDRMDTSKCPLWDNYRERNAKEIKEAAEAAQVRAKEQYPNLNTDQLAIPVGPPIGTSTLVTNPPVHNQGNARVRPARLNVPAQRVRFGLEGFPELLGAAVAPLREHGPDPLIMRQPIIGAARPAHPQALAGLGLRTGLPPPYSPPRAEPMLPMDTNVVIKLNEGKGNILRRGQTQLLRPFGENRQNFVDKGKGRAV